MIYLTTLATAKVISASPDVPEFCPAGVLLHASKSTDMSLSHLSTLKCHRPGPGTNPQPWASISYIYIYIYIYYARMGQVRAAVGVQCRTGHDSPLSLCTASSFVGQCEAVSPPCQTVRFEQQPAEVHAEKCRIYEPTVPFYLEKYHLTSIEVVGLMVGARGTIPLLFVSFCKKFQLNNDFIRDVYLTAIRGSLAILKYHLYFVS
ncbi:hypothetical protein ANN_16155 [Periplaneta americana]|uniref:Uncharacterized protein n=1 Tax=Periplaneta americana TaxID=6978 RepID=A0ABQ8SI68_PERAM|nr:hypothetical protein ANN_16155 [Periplaneta americana]